MTAFAALKLKNNALVDTVFAQQSIEAGVARWVKSETVFDASAIVSMSVTMPKNGSKVIRIKEKVNVPVMDTVDTTLKIADGYINIECVIPKNMSETQRLNLRSYAATLLDNAVNTAAFTSFEAIY